MGKRTFIAGVHGVGKGYLTSQLTKKLPFQAYSCSEIIKSYLGDLPIDKKVQDISRNQNVLVNGVNKIVAGRSVFLDGHFCLIDANGNIQPVPIKIFKALHLSAILLITAPAETIVERLMERDGLQHDIAHVREMQEKEIIHGKLISMKLNIPLLSCASGDQLDHVVDFIKQHM